MVESFLSSLKGLGVMEVMVNQITEIKKGMDTPYPQALNA